MALDTQMLGVLNSQTFDQFYGDRVLVTRNGARGNGTTDNLDAVQHLLDNVDDGTILVFPPDSDNTTYLIDGQLEVRGSLGLYTPGGMKPGTKGVTIKLADGANPVGVIVQAEWLTASTTCAEPTYFRVRVDGNKSNNTSGYGIIGTGYNSEYHGYATNCAQNGLRLPDRNSANTNLTGTMSNVDISHFATFECGEEGVDDGCLIEDHGTGCIVDGTMHHCKFEYSGRHGLNHQRLAGWGIHEVHCTASGVEGFRGANLFGTRIGNIYVDGFGAFDDGVTAIGFNMNDILAGRPSYIAGVQVCGGEASNPTNDYIYARFANQSGGVSTKIHVRDLILCQDSAGGASSVGLSLQPNNASGVLEFIESGCDWAGLSTTVGTGTVHRFDTTGRKLNTSTGSAGFMETLPLSSVNQSGASAVVGTGTLSVAYFQANQTATISTLTSATGSTAQASATLCRMALYAINPQTGDGTCIATTTSDTNLWIATATGYSKSITGDGQGGSISSVTLRQGRLYGFALLHVGGGSPTFVGKTIPQQLVPGAGPTTRAFGYVTGQTDIPASFLGTTIAANTASTSLIWGRCT